MELYTKITKEPESRNAAKVLYQDRLDMSCERVQSRRELHLHPTSDPLFAVTKTIN